MTTTQTPDTNPHNDPQHVAIVARMNDLQLLAAGREIDDAGLIELDALKNAAKCYWTPSRYTDRQQQAVRVLYSVAPRGSRDVAYIRCVNRVSDLLRSESV